MDVLKATSGGYKWNGNLDKSAQRKKIGTLLETPNFYHYLSAVDNLKIAAAIKQKGVEDIQKVLELVNLWQRKDSKFNTYSLGMKQRLAIASALLGDPDILVFDEPTNGLDPAGIAEIRELIKKLSQQGKTIIMASHILDEVEKVCTHVAIIQKGDLKAVGTVKDIMVNADDGNANAILVEIEAEDHDLVKKILQQMPGVVNIEEVEKELHVTFHENISGIQINKYCFDKGVVLNKIHVKRKSLEARFLEITGKQSDK
jgi:ABC-2 type transport system ATP-binding protein